MRKRMLQLFFFARAGVRASEHAQPRIIPSFNRHESFSKKNAGPWELVDNLSMCSCYPVRGAKKRRKASR